MPFDLEKTVRGFISHVQKAMQAQNGPAPTASPPPVQDNPAPVPEGPVPHYLDPGPPSRPNTAYGSAQLRENGKDQLREAVLPLSTQIIMGCNRPSGETGFVWDLAKHPAHAMTFGPTRKGGKGTSSIIPALLTYTAGSTLTIDPKGENAWVTAERLRKEGKRVVILDPWNEVNRRYGSKEGVTETVTRFNPLATLDPASPDFADDVSALADSMIIVPDTQNKYFDESARELVAGCIAAVVEANPGHGALRQVRELITLDESKLAEKIRATVIANPDSLAGRKLRRFASALNDGREIGSIRSTAETQTAFLDSETLLRGMETEENAFDLTELALGRVAFFLVLPVDRLETHGRWLRMVITLAIRAIARQETPPENPVLFLLDEMGTIGRLGMIESAYGLMAGLGIRLWGFLQDLGQLKGLYPKTWETFIANSSIIQVLKAHDITTSEYVSKYMGDMTVNSGTGGWNYKQVRWRPGEYDQIIKDAETHKRAELSRIYTESQLRSRVRSGNRTILEEGLLQARIYCKERMQKLGQTFDYKTEWTEDTQLIGRPLMDADKVRRLPADECLLLVPGEFPLIQYRTIYFKHPVFETLYRQNPYFTISQPDNTDIPT